MNILRSRFRSSIEIHFVFFNKKFSTYSNAAVSDSPKALAVFAVFAHSTSTSGHPFFDFTEKLSFVKKADSVHSIDFNQLPFHELIPLNGGYYTYEGSLTTPPCSEIVIWFILNDSLQISSKYMLKFRSILNHKGKPVLQNARGLVKPNKRKIYSQLRNVFVDVC